MTKKRRPTEDTFASVPDDSWLDAMTDAEVLAHLDGLFDDLQALGGVGAGITGAAPSAGTSSASAGARAAEPEQNDAPRAGTAGGNPSAAGPMGEIQGRGTAGRSADWMYLASADDHAGHDEGPRRPGRGEPAANHPGAPPPPPPLPLVNQAKQREMDLLAEVEEDLAAAEDLRQGHLSDATRAVYIDRWALFRTWAADRGMATEPVPVDVLAAFLGHLHRHGCKPATLQVYVAAIGWVHRQEHWPNPAQDERIRHLLEGSRRKDAGGRKKRRRLPVLACPDDGGAGEGTLHKLLLAIPPTVAGFRDRAIILLAWGGALRVSELVALDVDDVELIDRKKTVDDVAKVEYIEPGRLILTIGRSKTDQTGEGSLVTVAGAKDPRFCPAMAWKVWREISGITEGPAFRTLRAGQGHGKVGITATRLTERSVRRLIKHWAAVADLDWERISSHSMRRGFLTTAALKGVDPWKMQQHARHSSLRTTEQYVDMARARKAGAGEGLL